MLAHLSDWFVHSEYTCLAMVLLMALESAPVIGFFLPGSLLLIAIGSLTGAGLGNFIAMLACTSIGAIIGDSLSYWLGRLGRTEWREHLHRGGERQARQADMLVRRYGPAALFLGRFAWLVHVAVPLAGGVAGIRARDFYLLDTPAAILWCALYLALGHWATAAWIAGAGIAQIAILAGLLLALLGWAWWLRRHS